MQPPPRNIKDASSAREHWKPATLPILLGKPSRLAKPIQFPVASQWSQSHLKRFFDVVISASALMLLLLPMLAIAALIRLSTPGPALFLQHRVGRRGRIFTIYKFRTMTVGSSAGPVITAGGDARVTGFGRWLRRFKLDELPQFYNVLRGEMSLVGPRPKLPGYESQVSLSSRPGITGAATLAFCRQEEMLGAVSPPEIEAFYERQIKPLKTRLDLQYMSRATPQSDLILILATLFACLASPSRRIKTFRGPRTGAHPMLNYDENR